MAPFKISCMLLIVLCHLTCFGALASSGEKGKFSNEWLLQGELTTDEAIVIANEYGLEYSHEVLPGFYVFKKPTISRSSATPYMNVLAFTQDKLLEHPRVKSLEQQIYQTREARGRINRAGHFNVTDSWWNSMWHVHPDQYPSMGVYEAWEMGYSGAGINIAVLDDGVDIGHPDLIDNYIAEYSYDYLYENNYPIQNDGNFHGTWCAGIISAVKNDDCVLGVAYNSKFSAVKIYDYYLGLTPAGEAEALIHELGTFDIYSNSWGPSDNGMIFAPLDEVINTAFVKGVTEIIKEMIQECLASITPKHWSDCTDHVKQVEKVYWASDIARDEMLEPVVITLTDGDEETDTADEFEDEGRGGKGVIYTWAAGNGGDLDHCNCDGYASSIYTISVTSISIDTAKSWFSERCTSILAGTYGGDSPLPTIPTTDAGGGCTDVFQGTSANCPMAAGIIALVLEANPELTWRDVQYLIVETASHENLTATTFINGAGKEVSDHFGFGLMNAELMVSRSLTWKNVPEQRVCKSENIRVNGLSINGSVISSSFASDGCRGKVHYIEHVEVRMRFQSIKRGTLQIYLEAPSGLVSPILTTRQWDMYERLPLNWTFMSVHHWGENPDGEWEIRMETTDPTLIFSLFEWQLILYGTTTDPAEGRPSVEAQKADEKNDAPVIVGATLGGVALIALVVILVVAFLYCRPQQKIKDSPNTSNNYRNNIQGEVNSIHVTEADPDKF